MPWPFIRRWTALTVAVGFAFTACRTARPPLERHEFARPHMGTLWRITTYAPSEVVASNAAWAALERVKALDRMMTDYDPESELMRLCQSPVGVPVPVSRDLFNVLREAQSISRASGGAFDVTAGPVVQLWRRARRQHALPMPDRLAAARLLVGHDLVRLDACKQTVTLLKEKMRLDVGGIAKGYGADMALEELRRHGVPCALVAASGDLAMGDAPPGKPGWRVSIGALDRTNMLPTVLFLSNCGVSTSGDTEQFVEIDGVRYSHIVDPRTGVGLTNRLQTTVVADRTVRSDAIDTTICVLGREEGLRLAEREKVAALLISPGSGTNLVITANRRFEQLRARTAVR